MQPIGNRLSVSLQVHRMKNDDEQQAGAPRGSPIKGGGSGGPSDTDRTISAANGHGGSPKKIDTKAAIARLMRRWPKTMARLAQKDDNSIT